MNTQRLRAVLVTVAMVLGAGTMSALAAPLLQDDNAGVADEASESPTETTSEATEEPTEATEDPTEDLQDARDPSDDAGEANQSKGDDASAEAKKAAATAKAERDAAKAERDAARAERKAAKAQSGQSSGKGNGHGKAVSDAARGITEPVGECRNHGHWVSTVAKGQASCDDNPRPARGADD